ncbi:TPA: XRE family transcriptional regulator [Acinetobacter baumannii]|uniref:phage regulatory CII family protein n=1 Tax=Acinetobacter calcoaceticus/baumannii complex TaxID=909768 RepID=UPI0002972B98|nr:MULTISPECIES: phage regulatory CII family protein [Acinetobacter calcoaceticus/baumannii complex]EXD21300.1 hypothetical protein J480_4054 [Acinetobacter baumannii 34654]EIB7230201.1 XRE family transcriptional regulator [Acinetobacter baumannii]EIB7254219.1 XRE family transcriptional regulator [Acinetobacter baumannii]EIL2160721.1 XRE family transcriptional regulator [Acinetobacter baumannii]EKP55412.1 hypothetical protein ACINNAV2_2996 [Acinetobacter baumannii Naval-2]
MSEIYLSQEAQTALYKMIHQSPGVTPSAIADMLGDSHKTVLNYANPNMENHLPSLKKVEAILNYTQNPSLVKVWAHQLGFVLVPVDCDGQKHNELSILEALLQSNVANGLANQKIAEVLEDNIVTLQEYEETHSIFQKIIELVTAADKALQKMAKSRIPINLDIEKQKA